MPGDTLLQAFATPIFLRKNAGTPEMNAKLADTIRTMSADNTSDDAHRAHQGGFYTKGNFFDNETLPGVAEAQQMVGKASG